MEEKNNTLLEKEQDRMNSRDRFDNMNDRFDELKQSMIQLMQQNGIAYKETEDDGCETYFMHDGVQ